MTNSDIRLINQQIAETKFSKPQDIVSRMGAIQAQEYAMSKWAIGLRLPDVNDDDVEKAFNEGKILRTHLMRPTWHFVSPADIRWLLALTAPRVNAANAFMYRKMELDTEIFRRSNDVLINALQGGKHLTRSVLQTALEQINILGDGLRLSYLMMRAELDGIICSGPRQGNQFTYALLDERVPATRTLEHSEALAELSLRYFTSRGPATIKDFVYWSGLTMKEAKEGLSAIRSKLLHGIIEGEEYFFASGTIPKSKELQTTFLMPDYDEYGMSYKNRRAINFSGDIAGHIKGGNPVYDRMLIVDGKIAGTWKRTIKGNSVTVEIVPFSKLEDPQEVINAAQKFSNFIGKELLLNDVRILKTA